VRILLVDDDETVLRSLGRSLRADGVDVVQVQGAREALDLLDGTLDAVVSDQYLSPGPTGIWLLENVMHRRPDIPRVLFSGQRVPHAESLVQIGLVQAFLRKPVRAADVLRAIADLRHERISSNP